MTILVIGNAGFIGANFVLDWLALHDELVVSPDKLTCAGNRQNLASLDGDVRHIFVAGDIDDSQLVACLLAEHQPRAILNFAAGFHVDRSIHGPEDFIQTNIVGTFRLLKKVRAYWDTLKPETKAASRLFHISIDEAYGSLIPSDPASTENNRYEPNSPYSTSKAASDHLVRVYHHTYGLLVLTTNCSNNYGPCHPPEKLVPLVIHNVLAGKSSLTYGDGQQVRDWLYTEDHCSVIRWVLEVGQLGETYNVGDWNEKANLDVVETLRAILNQEQSYTDDHNYREQVALVKDRLSHDRRYTINITCLERKLGQKPAKTFGIGICKTVCWHLDNQDWVANVASDAYHEWVGKQRA